MKKEQALFSTIFPRQNENVVNALKEQNVTSFAMDCIPRISKAQAFDILSSMANIAG